MLISIAKQASDNQNFINAVLVSDTISEINLEPGL